MAVEPILILDFDSTIVSVESLDLLAEISLKHHPQRDKRLQQIADLTRLGMEGKLSVYDSLKTRIELLEAHRDHIPQLIAQLKRSITPSFAKNKAQLKRSANRLYVVTGGFREFVEPVVALFGISPKHVFANTFRFDAGGKIIGFDEKNPLCKPKGKAIAARSIKHQAPRYAVGDGSTDLEIRTEKAADKFYCFAEIIERASVTAKADKVVYGIDEILFESNIPMRYSYPRSRMKVLLLEGVDKEAVARMKDEGYRVETSNRALSEEELLEKISDVFFLGIRSKTQVTAKVMRAGKKLLGIGAFSVGTDQIDLEEATRAGISVFNAPFSNTRSVVELAVGEMILLIRKVTEQSAKLHQGVWNKSASGAHEIRGKKLGIIGYGNIGAQLSVLAENLGLEVYYFDRAEKLTLGNAKRCESLKELLKIADIITVHVDGRKENHHLIGAKEFAMMKPGVIFLNLSRGHVVSMPALKDAITSGVVAGAGVDVYPYEPKSNDEGFDSPLCGLPNTILTPHIGGSTVEAQKAIGSFVAERMLRFVGLGDTEGSVTLPQIALAPFVRGMRVMHIHENVPGILAKVNGILAEKGVNIVGQHLKTKDSVGYLVTDLGKKVSDEVLRQLRAVPHTIRVRVIFP